MKRRIDLVFLAAIAVLCTAPLVQMTTHVVSLTPLDELRTPHTVSAPLERLARLDATLAADVNAWFDDHYGFREVFVRANNELSYRLFRVSALVYVGDDGWLNGKSEIDGIVRDGGAEAADVKIVDGLVNLNACLASRGVRLVVLFNPAKPTIYPETLPWFAPPMPARTLYDRITKKLARTTNLSLIATENLLRRRKDEYELYYRTDPHLNSRGIAAVYSRVSRDLASSFGMSLPPNNFGTWQTADWPYGSEARFLGIFSGVTEVEDYPDGRQRKFVNDAASRWEQDVGNGAVEGYPDIPTFDWIFHNLRTDVQLLPPIMIFGTSFSDGFFDLGFDRAFATVYRTKSSIPSRIGPVLRDLPKDVKLLLLEYPEFEIGLAGSLGIGPHCEGIPK